MLVAPNRVAGLDSLRNQSNGTNNQPIMVVDGVPVSSPPSQDQYWMEVAQLTVQFDMVQKLSQRDTARAQLVGQMFGLEANARAQQRAYRTASEANRSAIRKQIEALITKHFDLEDQLRALEIADIERRLADVRAESQRRRDKRSEFIKFAVDDIIRDAIRPR
jgi:Arc/MetJ-type ribon-helix-helix transcriptional regulator